MLKTLTIYDGKLEQLPVDEKLLINTINAHSFNVAHSDKEFYNSLAQCNVLIPDGISIVLAIQLLLGKRLKKIAGADLFFYEMNRLNVAGGKCFFLGSCNTVLTNIVKRAALEYPNVIIETYSPPYAEEFTKSENDEMLNLIRTFNPDVLFIGMTAPKQEKWAFKHFSQFPVCHICCIGAVFDFYAGTVRRAPNWMIKLGFEWFYRLLKEPKRLWRRYIPGNIKFMWLILKNQRQKFFIVKSGTTKKVKKNMSFPMLKFGFKRNKK